MALSESGSGVQIGQMAYGPAGHRKVIKARKGPAKGSAVVRGGKKQSFFAKPRGRRR